MPTFKVEIERTTVSRKVIDIKADNTANGLKEALKIARESTIWPKAKAEHRVVGLKG